MHALNPLEPEGRVGGVLGNANLFPITKDHNKIAIILVFIVSDLDRFVQFVVHLVGNFFNPPDHVNSLVVVVPTRGGHNNVTHVHIFYKAIGNRPQVVPKRVKTFTGHGFFIVHITPGAHEYQLGVARRIFGGVICNIATVHVLHPFG
jgi:hypothetical protein